MWGYSSQWSWAFPAYLAGLRLIRQGKVNLIYSTGGAWSAHLAGLWLKKKTNLAWIVEVHDPLVIRRDEADLGLEIPKEPDAKKRHWLEQQICQHADLVWWFTEGALHNAKKRNPHLGNQGHAKGVMIIPGANPPDVDVVIAQISHHYDSHLNIAHFGSLAEDRSLTQVLEVLPQFFTEYPQAKDQIRFHIYGAQLDRKSKEWLNQSTYQDNVIERGRLEFDPSTGLTGRQQIAIEMQQSDILLLLHGNTEWCREYIPSKLYDYFWTSRPIWAITYKNDQLNHLIQERGGYISNSAQPNSIYTVLAQIWHDWEKHHLMQPKLSPITVETACRQIISQVNDLDREK